MKKLWKDKEQDNLDQGLFERPEGPPVIVLGAVVLLAALFLAGSIYLLQSGPFTGIEIIAPAELPEVTAAVSDYQGSLLGLENARQKVGEVLHTSGWVPGKPLTVYAQSPMRMRPIDVRCQAGYMLTLGYPIRGMPEPVRIEKLKPGRRLVVRVKGKGNYSGIKAYRAADRYLRKHGLVCAEGERFEIKGQEKGRYYIEHWIPVNPM
ncbi:hypothetical protein JW933_11030 [candidate division FCPU426 bacterium]|nr:hypothetical protein [candidate division FCPU426 bacterium]